MRLDFESVGISDIGLKRDNNEDVWAILDIEQFCVLADGMGGHQAGEVAARIAVDTACSTISSYSHDPSRKTLETATTAIKNAILKANQNVYAQSHANLTFAGMGTTLCISLLFEDTLIYAHVGDSRIYRFKDRLELLTQDHSLRNEIGMFDIEGASAISKNILTRAIGTSPEVRAEMGCLKVMPEEIYFLCSDGLSDAVSHQEMENILLKSPNIQEATQKLIDKAKEKGGTDNITVVMMKIM